MGSYLWKESKWENTNKKVVESCNRVKEKVYAKEGKGESVIKKRERRAAWVYWRTTEEEIYQTLKITSNCTGVFCRKERW